MAKLCATIIFNFFKLLYTAWKRALELNSKRITIGSSLDLSIFGINRGHHGL